MSAVPCQCDYCVRLQRKSEENPASDEYLYCCDAFPNGIPEEILNGEHDHTGAFDGDKDILFQAYSDEAAKKQKMIIEYAQE